jgi:EAL domain-containing protein (putative c-di-GMP-specific phosphodiesterase class I)
MNVNVCGASFDTAEFQADMLIALQQSGVADHLCIEITETTAISNISRAAAVVRQLQAIGATVALDDFGGGHMSAKMLQQLPVDVVKLDGQLIEGLEHCPRGRTIVRSTIDMCHDVGAIVVAEWVSNVATFNLVRKLGADFAQGYWCGKPMPALEMLRYAAEFRALSRSLTAACTFRT